MSAINSAAGRPVTLGSAAGNPATQVAATTAVSTLFTYSVPGGTLGTAGILRGTFTGALLNNGGSACLWTFAASYGGTTICSVQFSNGAPSSTVCTWQFNLILAGRGATNAQYGDVNATQNAGAANAASASNAFFFGGQNTTLAIDSTQPQTLLVTVQMSVSNAGATTSFYAGSVEQIA